MLRFTASDACAVAAGNIIYVDEIAAGANDSSSWDDAYNFLQDALADANEAEKPVEIRLAQGSYSPDKDTLNPEGTADRQRNRRNCGAGRPYHRQRKC